MDANALLPRYSVSTISGFTSLKVMSNQNSVWYIGYLRLFGMLKPYSQITWPFPFRILSLVIEEITSNFIFKMISQQIAIFNYSILNNLLINNLQSIH